jgi:ubiquinol-cytochrome c reductase cytochrome c subunit
LQRGQTIFEQRCAVCHGVNGEGVNAPLNFAGPSLQAEHDRGAAMAAMEAGKGHMPTFAYVLSVQNMRDAADYVTQRLATIPLDGGDLAQGGKLFRVYCAPCHRTAVRGGALVFTGINAPDLTSVSAGMIGGAIREGPGPMPKFPPSLLDDQQLASIVKYVRFVQRPPSPGGSPMQWMGPVAEGFTAWIVLFGLVGMAGWIEKGGKG